MNILITGVHGFVGSNLVSYLASDNTIYGLDIVSHTRSGIVKTFSWDDLDRDDVIPSVDAVIHLAGKAHDTKNHTDSDVYFKVNTDLTKRIYDWFLAHSDCKRFVFFSTAKAAADRVEGVLTEDITPSPIGPYGESKIAAERYILERLTESKRVYIFRPCMIHGPGNKGNLNLLYSVVKRGIPWPLGSYDNRRTFTSVGNVCVAVDGVLTQEVATGIYNLGDDETLSTNELIEEIALSLGKKVRIWQLPRSVMHCVATIGSWLHLPMNRERLSKLTENYVSSNAKLKAALGITKMPISARDGLRITLESFKERL